MSTPLDWHELEHAIDAGDPFEMDAVLERIKAFGDLFAPVLSQRQELVPQDGADIGRQPENASLHFTLGDVIRVLRKRGGGAKGKKCGDNAGERTRPCVLAMAASPSRTSSGFTGIRYDGHFVLRDFHKSHLFFLSLCIRAIRGRCCRFCPRRLHIEVAFT